MVQWMKRSRYRILAQAQTGEKDEIATCVAILRECTKNRDIYRGTRFHYDIVRRGLLKQCSDALVTMHAKCGALERAKELFEIHKSKDVLTWTALITGYVQEGQGEDALNYFEQMQCEGLTPDAVTFSCVLKACGSIAAVDKGGKVHEQIAKLGLLRKNVMLGNALVDMYVKCGALATAHQVLEDLAIRDAISWTTLIAGYAQQGEGEEALSCFDQMRGEGVSPDVVTFICVLKACVTTGATDKGKEIHDEISSHGLLSHDAILGNALIDMYAKGGALEKAREMLEELPVRDVTSWNTLISGYNHHCQGAQAVLCLEKMRSEGLSPDAVTFICLLKACGSIGEVEKGGKIHEEVAKQGLLGNDIVLGNALVGMYAKCGALPKARQVFEELPDRNITSWNSLIAGHVQHGEGAQALDCLEQMRSEGLCPDAVTFICSLKSCGSIRAIDKGKKIHEEIIKEGLLRNHVVLNTALVDMYAKCGALAKARQGFEELGARDVISWSALITAYAQQGEAEHAIVCFEKMWQEGLSPDAVTFVWILKCCGTLGALDKGYLIHDMIAKQGMLDNNIELASSLMEMYANCSALEKAQQVLEELPSQDIFSWNVLISGCVQEGDINRALHCFDQLRQEGLLPDAVTFTSILKACGSIAAADKGEKIHVEIANQGLAGDDTVLRTALVDMYAKCGALAQARQVFYELPVRDVISWNSLIAGYIQDCDGIEALNCFEGMQYDGISPDMVTFMCILKACGSIRAVDQGEYFHHEIAEQGLLGNNLMLANALIAMYAKLGALSKAQQVLEKRSVRDVFSWNALIAGYVEQGEGKQALNCFDVMQHEGICPDAATFTLVMKSCGSTGAAGKGAELHDQVSKQGLLECNLVVGTALVDMYAKFGALARAQQVLEELPTRDVVSWNALITGYTHIYRAAEALICFRRMQQEGLSPDAATFSCMLTACSRLGLVEHAGTCFMSMSMDHGMDPDWEHYACMVDLLGRAGYLDKANEVIQRMPSSNRGVWPVLLGACRKWGHVNVGKWAFDHAVQVDKFLYGR